MKAEFKSTEVGTIPKEWELAKLNEVVDADNDIVAGPFGSNLKVVDYRPSGVPIIRLQNIERNKFVNKDIKFISKEKAEELKYHSFISGDIVLAKLGDPIGKTCIVPESLKNGIVVADVVRIRVSTKKADKLFIVHVLNSETCSEQLKKETIGSTRPRVNISQIRKIKIPLPPLSEQQKISDILSSIDAAIDIVERESRLVERLKVGVMKELFDGKKWKNVTLGNEELFNMIMGQSPPSNSYNREKVGLPFLQGNSEFGPIYPVPTIYCSNPLKIAKKGDILISVRAPVGDINIANTDCCIGRGIGAIRTKDHADNQFLFYYLKFVSSKLESISGGSTFKAITRSQLENFEISLPSLEEQKRIAQILSTLDEKISLTYSRKSRLEKIKKGLMNELLTGKKRVIRDGTRD